MTDFKSNFDDPEIRAAAEEHLSKQTYELLSQGIWGNIDKLQRDNQIMQFKLWAMGCQLWGFDKGAFIDLSWEGLKQETKEQLLNALNNESKTQKDYQLLWAFKQGYLTRKQ